MSTRDGQESLSAPYTIEFGFGSTALMLAREWVQAGLADVALAAGFEQMSKEAMAGPGVGPEAVSTIDRHLAVMRAGREQDPKAPMMAPFFGHAAIEHMDRYGTAPKQLAKVAVKPRRLDP
jgi:acetyl-CoA acetyltransferase